MKENGLNIIGHKKFEKKKIREEFVVFTLTSNKVVENVLDEPPEEIREVLRKFLDVFLSKLTNVLPPMYDI